MIKKDIITKHSLKFTEGVQWAEDTEYFCKIMSLANVCAVNKHIAYKEIREGSLTIAKFNEIDGSKLSELIMWDRFEQWLITNSNNIDYDVNEIKHFISTYLCPILTINYLFKLWWSTDDANIYHKKYNMQKYIDNFRPIIDYRCIVLIFKYIAILLKLFSCLS